VRHATFLIVIAIASTGLSADPQSPAKDPLNGTWTLSSGVMSGKNMADDVVKSVRLALRNGKYIATVGDEKDEGSYTVNQSKTPPTITLVGTQGPNKGKTMLAIYELESGTLKVCYDLSGKAFPEKFESKPDTQSFLATYERQKSRRARGGRLLKQ
jgi:uncharacterized protein (TIGR03067 family)